MEYSNSDQLQVDAVRKTQLRKQMRALRQSLSATAQTEAAANLIQFVKHVPNWRAAQNVALYLANDGEINTEPVIEFARRESKSIFLPVVSGQQLEFALWRAGDDLHSNRFGILEPAKSAPRLKASALDIVCLPVVAWDECGTRLGMGGGFYDRALASATSTDTLLVGLAHERQRVAKLPKEDWDVALSYVATDVALLRCQNGEA